MVAGCGTVESCSVCHLGFEVGAEYSRHLWPRWTWRVSVGLRAVFLFVGAVYCMCVRPYSYRYLRQESPSVVGIRQQDF